MSRSKENSRPDDPTRRLLVLAFVAVISIGGCGKPTAYVAAPISPSDEFSNGEGLWQRSKNAPSKTDNQQIGKFFRKRPELVGSPEWTGQPEKYISQDSKSLVRFYWFSGNEENPSWNALEIKGARIRELSGTGVPGAEEKK